MKDKDRALAEQLADGIGEMLQRGDSTQSIERHLLKTLAPTSNHGPWYGECLVRWAVSWVACGRPNIVVDHKLAASIMATEIPSEFADEIPPPWQSFMATVPAGLLCEGEVSVFVDRGPNRQTRMMLFDRRDVAGQGGKGVVWNICQPWSEYAKADLDEMRRLTEAEGHESSESRDNAQEANSSQARRGLLIAVFRFVFGCCVELSNRASIVSGPQRAAVSRRQAQAPSNWSIRLSRAVRVDARTYVRQLATGERRKITLQYMRRGHWRNQAHGPRHTLRKVIHVEPTWVGPEDAPIAVRSHVLST